MMSIRARPLSPHLQIYRWQIGNSLSMLHRLTGVALALGLIALCSWVIALASGERSYDAVMRAFASPLGIAVMMGWTFAFMFHFLNGLRHLFWDAGLGFERTQRHASGWFAVFGAVALTAGAWIYIWASHRS
jgi:succinate dehydrogenase / fumarate reductase cytochrome b subunit